MKAIIYVPSRNAMQSGQQNSRRWVVEHQFEKQTKTDPLMGWSGSNETRKQVRLYFNSRDEAISYATRNNIEFELNEPQVRKKIPKSYSENFSFNKVT